MLSQRKCPRLAIWGEPQTETLHLRQHRATTIQAKALRSDVGSRENNVLGAYVYTEGATARKALNKLGNTVAETLRFLCLPHATMFPSLPRG